MLKRLGREGHCRPSSKASADYHPSSAAIATISRSPSSSTLRIRVRVQLIGHLKTCTTDIYIKNECAHVGLSIHAPVDIVTAASMRDGGGEGGGIPGYLVVLCHLA